MTLISNQYQVIVLQYYLSYQLNLKFEVEVLCKNLQIDINDIKPVRYLRDPQIKFSIECQVRLLLDGTTTRPLRHGGRMKVT